MRIVYFLVACMFSFQTLGNSSYTVEASSNDEIFIVDGEVYKAQTYCIGFADRGDEIYVVDGTHGLCVSAKLINKSSGESCDVWCE